MFSLFGSPRVVLEIFQALFLFIARVEDCGSLARVHINCARKPMESGTVVRTCRTFCQ